MHRLKDLVRIVLRMSSERRDHQVHVERVERVGDPPRVAGRDETVSLLSNNPSFDRVVPAFHERRPSLLETLVKWSGLHDRTYDRAMFDARFHDAPIRFPQRCDRFSLSINPGLAVWCMMASTSRNNETIRSCKSVKYW